MPARTTFPVAKASLYALLKQAFAASKVRVDYGDPGISKLQREHVFMSGTGEDGQSWAPFGSLKRDEQYGIQLWVHAVIPGATQQRATERAHDIFAVIEEAIRPIARTASQIAPGMYLIEVYQRGVTEFNTDEGAACLIEGEFLCKARI